MSLWFVSPAWQRYEITAICLEQRQRAIETLARSGIAARQVVVADDENLDIARALGADTVEMDNTLLGRRWNAGMIHAANQGAEWIVQIGSDSWIDPAFFIPLAPRRLTLTSTAYCAVKADRLARLRVSPRNMRHSAGPYVFHRSILAPSGYAPCAEDSRMTDTSTVSGIERTCRHPIYWRPRTVHPFQYVGFRVEPLMTTYEALQRWLVKEYADPWAVLAHYYPEDLVARARKVMTA